MVIEIKYQTGIYTFGDWKTGAPDFIWYRSLLTIDGKEHEDGIGIALLKFDGRWSIRFFNSHAYHIVYNFYKTIYPHGREYADISEAKEDIDKILYRANSLKVFL